MRSGPVETPAPFDCVGRPATRPRRGPERCASMPSSVIRAFDYVAASSELVVTFTTGRVYVYSGVPAAEAERFRAAFAKGVHFNRYIRDRYLCREVDSE